MKKRDLTTLAMIGISAGLIVGGCQQKGNRNNPNNPNNPPSNNKGYAAEQLSPDMQAFYSSLSPDAQQKFMQLDAQHRMMAVEMANQQCTGKNKCAGMGGCDTADHKCGGQNACKGQGGDPVKDANKAVEIQYRNQTGQRQNTNGKMGGNGTSNPYGSSTNSPSGSSNPSYVTPSTGNQS